MRGFARLRCLLKPWNVAWIHTRDYRGEWEACGKAASEGLLPKPFLERHAAFRLGGPSNGVKTIRMLRLAQCGLPLEFATAASGVYFCNAYCNANLEFVHKATQHAGFHNLHLRDLLVQLQTLETSELQTLYIGKLEATAEEIGSLLALCPRLEEISVRAAFPVADFNTRHEVLEALKLQGFQELRLEGPTLRFARPLECCGRTDEEESLRRIAATWTEAGASSDQIVSIRLAEFGGTIAPPDPTWKAPDFPWIAVEEKPLRLFQTCCPHTVTTWDERLSEAKHWWAVTQENATAGEASGVWPEDV